MSELLRKTPVALALRDTADADQYDSPDLPEGPDESLLSGEEREADGWRFALGPEAGRGAVIPLSFQGVMYRGTVVDVRESLASTRVREDRYDSMRKAWADGAGVRGLDLDEYDPFDHTRLRLLIVCVDTSDPLNAPTATFLDDTEAIMYLKIHSRCTVTTLEAGEVVDFRGVYCDVRLSK